MYCEKAFNTAKELENGYSAEKTGGNSVKQEYFFKDAKWVCDNECTAKSFSVLRGHFYVSDIKSASLNVLGLGFFKCYINGQCINPDTFLPLSSEYEGSKYPKDEVFSGHRVYVPHFDITPFVLNGDNTIAIYYGGGWYCHPDRVFGMPKAIYSISVNTENGECGFVSDQSCKIRKGHINDYYLTEYECHNYMDLDDCLSPEYDDTNWEYATLCEALDTEYCETDCPADALIKTIPIKELKRDGNRVLYDCGRNITGYPVLELNAASGETVQVEFSEEISATGNLDASHSHNQKYTVISDGKVRLIQPEFTWYGFRYFEVEGNATPLGVKIIHADISVSSTFHCDNETLNWIYNTFINTMLCNMHIGHPSDCPHLERRGYTGDGQLTCNAVLSIFDAKAFYEKWLQDIADSQDSLSGHIQYTAPYIHSGGGPGGWGCAIVEVPYQLYRHFGDAQILKKYYRNMRRYIDYLEAHSEFGLVTSDKEGDWCLGDWCGPNILYPEKDITYHNQQVILPAPMVNTYFMVKSLNRLCEIAQIIGKEEDVTEYREKAEQRKKAINSAYFNTFDGNFIMNVQGANAYAVDLNLGDDTTYSNMVDYYKKLGYYDTGIFATDILTRVLFENGDSELAVNLLTHDGEQGFEHWRQNGATTFHEYWDSNRSRSHNHPMFGAPVAYIFEYLLGIRQNPFTAGYSSVLIEPQAVSMFNQMSGSIKTPNGEISVSYVKENGAVSFKIVIPKNITAIFKYNGQEFPLAEGENSFNFNCQ